MGLGTTTIEMESPEAYRERLHDLVKASSAVLVLTCDDDARIVGQPMVLLRTTDDTTMYAATALGAARAAALSRDPRVTVVVPGASCAMFDAEATISRDRELLDARPAEAWRRWARGTSDPALAVLVISPIEGTYWEGTRRHVYQYRLALPRGRRELSDGAPVAVPVEARAPA